MPSRLVLSDCCTMPWLEKCPNLFELLNIKLTAPLLFLCFCSDGSNQHKMWAAKDKSVFIWEAGWEEPFGNNSTLSFFFFLVGVVTRSSARA